MGRTIRVPAVHYRHLYHAGNFADVFKHVLLTGLLRALSRKDKPWCCLDTHAGAGRYDLSSEQGGRTGEWEEGIGRLWRTSPTEATVAHYLAAVRALNPGRSVEPRLYPGSPWLAAQQARPGDRVLACEQVAEVAETLGALLPSVEVHCRNGYEALTLLPPRERRGLVLVDPPFERPDEFEAVTDFIERVTARFAGGVCALWYPLKNRHAAGRAVRRLARASARPVLDLQIDIGGRGDGRMHACGLAVVNPPFGFETTAQAALDALAPLLGARVQQAMVGEMAA